MKYVKMLGLAAVAAAALMAFVGTGTASAEGILCKTPGTGETTGTTCPEGWAYGAGTVIHAVNVGNVLLDDANGNTVISCKKSTIQGTTTTETTPEGTVEALTFEECNNEVKVLKTGTLQVHWIKDTHNGTLTANGQEVTVNISTIFGKVHCIYVTNAVSIGDITGGAPAIFHSNATLEEQETSGLCPKSAKWTATYEVTTPNPLYIAGHT